MTSESVSPNLIQTICTALGTAIGGPAGGIVGSAIGIGLAAAWPSPRDITANIAADYVEHLLPRMMARVRTTLTGAGEPRKLVNHDLQEALSDAIRMALVDLGGRECFADAWKQQAPPAWQQDVCYFHTMPGSNLQKQNPALAAQTRETLQAIHRSIDEQQPLSPQTSDAATKAVNVHAILRAPNSVALADEFFEAVAAPYLTGYGQGLGLTPQAVAEYGFVRHLRRHLFSQTLLNLGELLKERTLAWRAFTR